MRERINWEEQKEVIDTDDEAKVILSKFCYYNHFYKWRDVWFKPFKNEKELMNSKM